jgi:hypothetical protein
LGKGDGEEIPDTISNLRDWFNNEGGDNQPILIIKIEKLSVDQRRWITGLVAQELFQMGSKAGLSEILPETSDPRANVCFVLEEAHVIAPERGFSIGADDEARRYCEGHLRNIMLHARKFGIGVMLASQRSAFIDKGVLSQCNTLFAMKTISSNDKQVFKDYMDKDWIELVSYLETPPDKPQAILVGKASSSSNPLLINYDCYFESG